MESKWQNTCIAAASVSAVSRKLTRVEHLHPQTSGLFVEVFSGQHVPVPETGITPVRYAVSPALNYTQELGSNGYAGALFKLAGALTNFSLRFTGETRS